GPRGARRRLGRGGAALLSGRLVARARAPRRAARRRTPADRARLRARGAHPAPRKRVARARAALDRRRGGLARAARGRAPYRPPLRRRAAACPARSTRLRPAPRGPGPALAGPPVRARR